jgi:hypothetical protein
VILLGHDQHSPEWYGARLGLPTASEFGKLITPKRGDLSTRADDYIDELIDELVRPEAERGWGGNRHTDRGNELEPDACAWYELQHDVEVNRVGLILTDDRRAGCSPDRLVGPLDAPLGGLEVKCPDGPTHVGYLRAGTLPDKYKPQVHGSLVITGLPFWDFLSFCPGYRRLLVRVYPDDYTAKVRNALTEFLKRYDAAKAQFLKVAA